MAFNAPGLVVLKPFFPVWKVDRKEIIEMNLNIHAFTRNTLLILASLMVLSGCEKVSNSAKNLQSDWVGLDRKVELYSCMDGRLVKSYKGSVRVNPEDSSGTSLLINGKKLHTNLCYVITELGIVEQPLSAFGEK